MIWPAVVDRPLVEVLRAYPASPSWLAARAAFDARALLHRAELHGVSGVVEDALEAAGVDPPSDVARTIAARRLARELDHEAHLGMLRRIDAALARAGLVAVVLKGPLFAERFYPRPSARATSDIDLLVDERLLDVVAAKLEEVGYRRSTAPEEERFRREHHHLHLEHEGALPLELHFLAYRGFGRRMPSEELVARGVSAPGGYGALRVLSVEDELAYLAVHAAAHRFVRLGWLFDLKLLLATMTPAQVEVAAERARAWGFSTVLAWTGVLLSDVLAIPRERVAPLGGLGPIRKPLLRRVTAEPGGVVARSATRLVYTVALCDSAPSAGRYVRRASAGHVRRILGLAP